MALASLTSSLGSIPMSLEKVFTYTNRIFIFQEITRLSFKVCIKDSQGISQTHDPVTVDYAVVGGTDVLCLA